MKVAKPFILKSETKADANHGTRRATLISKLKADEVDQIAGGTNCSPDIAPDWDPSSGGDHDTSPDYGTFVASIG